MAINRDVHYRVTFRPGLYRYSNNRWLLNVASVTLEAQGCTFLNISGDPFEQNYRPLCTNSIFQDHGDRPVAAGNAYVAGLRIRSAPAGASVVHLARAAESRRIAVGSRVMMHSFDQQWGGYPPNMRFFEWHRVAAIDTASGAIALETQLRHDHEGNLPDTLLDAATGLTVGAARLLPLDRRHYRYPELIEIVGATFEPNPNHAPGGLIAAADRLALYDCRYRGPVWPSENRLALYENCRMDHAEPDKLCDRVEFRHCHFAAPVIGATGVNELVMTGCEVQGHIAISPRIARLAGNRIVAGADPYGAVRSYYDCWPIRLLECVDTVVDGRVHSVHWAINAGAPENPRRLVVEGRGPTNEILISDTPSMRSEVVAQLMIGSVVRLQGTSKMGLIARLGWTGSQWLLAGDWAVAVAAGQVWEFCNVQSVREKGTRFLGLVRPVLRQLDPTQVRLS